MQRDYGLIANPYARGGRKQLGPIERLAKKKYRDTVSYHATNEISEISGTLIKLINQRKIKILFIFGGDGTIHKVIDILIYELLRGNIDRLPLILPIGGGTMEAVFQWLGWDDKPINIFRKGLEIDIDKIPIRKLRPLKITFWNADTDRLESHYGFFFIIGAVNRVIQLYDRQGKSVIGGIKHIVQGATAALTGLPPTHKHLLHQFDAKIFANGKILPQNKPLSIICSVCDSLLFGDKFYGIKPYAGRAESNQFYCMCYSLPAWIPVAVLPFVMKGILVPKTDFTLNQPLFLLEATTKKEDSIFIDGDFYKIKPGETIKVEPGPEIEMGSFFDK
ncbi:hypothetical protein A2533_02815 [Candidatus Falkowbacteria bacterium RIFOXYD2_FULL_35_9]|nr:MAG: hypothetical protein A2223_02430 [Candidatus Falkowbacteria bacterium RIFOXYA2_FULL_35_8]OGF47834.1 MAG: hypothetical protein A2533_02815 [Candidatus Falkowbacteria bacterium RIFOXYD2_FULL_35_9]